jgi:hypothetical protein
VKAKRYAEILERRPERLVVRIVPVMTIDNIGAEKNCSKAQRLDAATGLSNRVVDVKRRNHAGAEELARTGLAEFIEPVIVGAGESRGEFAI